MKHSILFSLTLFLVFSLFAQPKTAPKPDRPKIVVGLMVDQMRWDFLYRFSDRYGEGGFKRLIREGFTCDNTYIPYAQTVTACGHASVYSGSVPAINGIMGNEWYDRALERIVYCVWKMKPCKRSEVMQILRPCRPGTCWLLRFVMNSA
jgi:predicted AlkP superfamily pyrophosphatase or phosphodiesterase